MTKMHFSLMLFFIGFFTWQEGFSQKKLEVKLLFTESVNKEKLLIRIDDGKDFKDVNFEIKEKQVIIRDTFYGKLAAIILFYTDENDNFQPFEARFFVSEKPAVIRFSQKVFDKNPIGNYSFENALDINKNEDVRQLKSFAAKEEKDVYDFFRANKNKMNDTLFSILQPKADIWLNKKTEFFKHCSGSYFCFWMFKNEVALNNTIPSDSLLAIYQNAFPDSLKSSFEGIEIVKHITGRSEKKDTLAPNFTANDIKGNNISLDMFKGTYVLIDFWASWCGPCVKKMPDIKGIRKKYSDKKLKIIFITQDNNIKSFENAIAKQGIDFGIHIFSTSDLIKLYGAQAIPKTFLIDPKGIIIYNNQIEKDFDLDSHILIKLLEEKLK